MNDDLLNLQKEAEELESKRIDLQSRVEQTIADYKQKITDLEEKAAKLQTVLDKPSWTSKLKAGFKNLLSKVNKSTVFMLIVVAVLGYGTSKFSGCNIHWPINPVNPVVPDDELTKTLRAAMTAVPIAEKANLPKLIEVYKTGITMSQDPNIKTYAQLNDQLSIIRNQKMGVTMEALRTAIQDEWLKAFNDGKNIPVNMVIDRALVQSTFGRIVASLERLK